MREKTVHCMLGMVALLKAPASGQDAAKSAAGTRCSYTVPLHGARHLFRALVSDGSVFQELK